MKYYLGVDVGSVSTKLVCIDENNTVLDSLYIRTFGSPVESLKKGLSAIKHFDISGVGVTGSARNLAGKVIGADYVKNEITCHAVAALNFYPDVKTILEIGGQDSKIILLRNKVVTDFAMNNVCAAGTGSFLDQQAFRLGIPIEQFGELALCAKTDISIAGRCTVFAESDMIHKQQLGYSKNDIINGLCLSLVRNYFSTVGKGKEILEPILFQGGVAANIGMTRAFEKYLGKKVIVPEHYGVMGAVGAAILSKSTVNTKFKGFEIVNFDFYTKSRTCDGCPNNCEIVEVFENNVIIARFGDRCGRFNI